MLMQRLYVKSRSLHSNECSQLPVRNNYQPSNVREVIRTERPLNNIVIIVIIIVNDTFLDMVSWHTRCLMSFGGWKKTQHFFDFSVSKVSVIWVILIYHNI